MKHGWKRLGKGCVSMHLQAVLQGRAGNRKKKKGYTQGKRIQKEEAEAKETKSNN